MVSLPTWHNAPKLLYISTDFMKTENELFFISGMAKTFINITQIYAYQTHSQEPDPTANLDLSFKLQLSESEREARSQVILPYLKDG